MPRPQICERPPMPSWSYRLGHLSQQRRAIRIKASLHRYGIHHGVKALHHRDRSDDIIEFVWNPKRYSPIKFAARHSYGGITAKELLDKGLQSRSRLIRRWKYQQRKAGLYERHRAVHA